AHQQRGGHRGEQDGDRERPAVQPGQQFPVEAQRQEEQFDHGQQRGVDQQRGEAQQVDGRPPLGRPLDLHAHHSPPNRSCSAPAGSPAAEGGWLRTKYSADTTGWAMPLDSAYAEWPCPSCQTLTWVACARSAFSFASRCSATSITVVISWSAVTGSSPGSGSRNGRSGSSARVATPA